MTKDFCKSYSSSSLSDLQDGPEISCKSEMQSTLTRWLPCVQVEVILQQSFLRKRLVTEWASERLGSGVGANVATQVALPWKAFFADQTEMLFALLHMIHVALQVLKDFVTLSAQVWPLKQSLFGILWHVFCSHVTLCCVFSWQSFVFIWLMLFCQWVVSSLGSLLLFVLLFFAWTASDLGNCGTNYIFFKK